MAKATEPPSATGEAKPLLGGSHTQRRVDVTADAATGAALPPPESYKAFRRPQAFRRPGSPAGSWHHTPWWVCVLHDPYERINFWSHFLPGVALVVLGIAAFLGLAPGATPMWVFCACAATTHLASALTHVWPDDHALEKLDHIGIVALVAGTPFTAALARRPGGDLTIMGICTIGLFVAAFMPPLPRTLGFVGIGVTLFFSYFFIVNANMSTQAAMYLACAPCFIRNSGHKRWTGFSDHHFLHYLVTAACCLQVAYILNEANAHAL